MFVGGSACLGHDRMLGPQIEAVIEFTPFFNEIRFVAQLGIGKIITHRRSLAFHCLRAADRLFYRQAVARQE